MFIVAILRNITQYYLGERIADALKAAGLNTTKMHERNNSYFDLGLALIVSLHYCCRPRGHLELAQGDSPKIQWLAA